MKKQSPSAGNLILLEDAAPIARDIEEIQSRIRQRAFEISSIRGHSGREVEDWLSAESEIISVPPAEVVEVEGVYRISVAIAGVDPDAVKIMMSAHQVLIRADFRHEHETAGVTVHLCDFKSATVFRSIQLPERINLKTIKVEFSDGLLRITSTRQAAMPADNVRTVTVSPKTRPKPKPKSR
jgi:HSP20 family molecular chaperone IbpA